MEWLAILNALLHLHSTHRAVGPGGFWVVWLFRVWSWGDGGAGLAESSGCRRVGFEKGIYTVQCSVL